MESQELGEIGSVLNAHLVTCVSSELL
jgi:hypothetical protein